MNYQNVLNNGFSLFVLSVLLYNDKGKLKNNIKNTLLFMMD